MTREVVKCSPDTTLHHVAGLMEDRGCGSVVVTGAEGKVIGMVTDRDICRLAHQTGRRLVEIPARAAMSHKVHTCRPDVDLSEAQRIMQTHKVRRLPVVDEFGILLGIIALDDIAREIVAIEERVVRGDREAASLGVYASEVGYTLAVVARKAEQSS
ncbi:MAG: CBS domain-containing protein [Acidobacteriota bacterium]